MFRFLLDFFSKDLHHPKKKTTFAAAIGIDCMKHYYPLS